MKLIIVLGIVLIFGISHSSCKRYDGYRLFRVTFETERQAQIKAIINEVEGAEIWLFSIADGIADIFTSPEAEPNLLSLLVNNGFSFYLLNRDVQSLIDGARTVKLPRT